MAVMSYAAWQAKFGGVNDIVGKTLRLNNLVFTIIGVAPPRFIGVSAIFGPDLWIPAAMVEQAPIRSQRRRSGDPRRETRGMDSRERRRR